MRLKRYIILAMMLAISVVLSYVESFIPMFVPGVKLGLANLIVLIMLYEFKVREAILVLFLRILLVSLIKGNIMQMQFFMSLCGGCTSCIIMTLFSRIKVFSVVGVSVLGAISHCIGQIVIAMIMLQTAQFIYYLPFIGLLSTLTGVFTGLISKRYLTFNMAEKLGILKDDIDKKV